MAEFVFSLNGREVTVEADPKTPSLEVLREHLGVHTCKAGCSPQGICGCCTALLDGKPRLTCTLPVKSLAGKAVTTMDGLPEADRALFAESFVCTGGTQCGYCTPGIVLNAWSVLQANASPTPDEITRALQAHLCRCTGYTAIAAAIERAAAVKRGEADVTPPRSRPEGADVVLGDRPYVDDLERPGMLYGGAVFAPVAVGTVDAVELDAARAIPGVRLVQARKQAGDTLAHAGEIVVAIAAESPSAVRAAVAAVVVKATARAAVTDLASAPVVGHATVRTGDVDAGLASAAHRAGGHFRVAPSDPVYLEPEAALAVPTGTDAAPSLHVYSAGHDAAGEAAALTEALGVPVRVFLVPSGGSYGGKEVRLVAQVAGELARATGGPVRLGLPMEAGMRVHPRRPAGLVDAELGTDDAGHLVGVKLSVTLDGGAAPLEPQRLAAEAAEALAYACPAVEISVRVVRTDNPSAGPVRGGGGVAVTFAVEQCLSELARARGEDGFHLRRRNVTGEAARVLGALLPAVEGGATGVGLARSVGAAGARVVLRVLSGSEIEVQCNVPELGQGRDEALSRALVAATGLDAGVFSMAWADSSVIGAGAAVSAPVEEAAAAAGAALVAAGGSLAERVGERFVGECAAAAANVAGAAVTLGAGGEVTHIVSAAGCGGAQEPRMVVNLLEGAGHMGLGLALSEEVDTKDGLGEGRLRYLGVLKPKGCAKLAGLAVPVDGAARDAAEAAVMAVPAAVAVAVGGHEARVRAALPMKDSAAARHVGVRPPRPEVPGKPPAA